MVFSRLRTPIRKETDMADEMNVNPMAMQESETTAELRDALTKLNAALTVNRDAQEQALTQFVVVFTHLETLNAQLNAQLNADSQALKAFMDEWSAEWEALKTTGRN